MVAGFEVVKDDDLAVETASLPAGVASAAPAGFEAVRDEDLIESAPTPSPRIEDFKKQMIPNAPEPSVGGFIKDTAGRLADEVRATDPSRALYNLGAGMRDSVTGLALNEGRAQEEPESVQPRTLPERLARQLGVMVGDLPAMIGGYMLGGGQVTGMAGAFALPEALKAVYAESQRRGESHNFSDFLDKFTAELNAGVKAGGKGYITGLATGGVGKLAPTGTKTIAEAVTMPTVGHQLEQPGEMPSTQDYLDAAILLLGLKGASLSAGKIQEVYSKARELADSKPLDSRFRGDDEEKERGDDGRPASGSTPAPVRARTPEMTPAEREELARYEVVGEEDLATPGNVPERTPPTGKPLDSRLRGDDSRGAVSASSVGVTPEGEGRMVLRNPPVETEAVSSAPDSRRFIKAPSSGAEDFGEISEEVGREIKQANGPIRLEEGNVEYGRLHIEKGKLKRIQEAGYPDVESFVEDVARNYSQIWRQNDNGRLLLVKRNGKAKVLVVELQERGGYYGVTTAYPEAKENLKPTARRSLLWEDGPTTASEELGSAPPSLPSNPAQGSKPGAPGGKGQSNSSINRLPPDGSTVKEGKMSRLWGEDPPDIPIVPGPDNPVAPPPPESQPSRAELTGRAQSDPSTKNIPPSAGEVKKGGITPEQFNRQLEAAMKRAGESGRAGVRVAGSSEVPKSGSDLAAWRMSPKVKRYSELPEGVRRVIDSAMPEDLETARKILAKNSGLAYVKVEAPDGGVVFERITSDISRQAMEQSGARIDPGEIHLEVGMQSHNSKFGLAHIQYKRGGQLAEEGFTSVGDFVSHVLEGFNEIRQGDGKSLLLVKTNGRTRVAAVELTKPEGGIFYRVKSAYVDEPERINLEKRKLLWRREPPSAQTGTGSPESHPRPLGASSRKALSGEDIPGRTDPSLEYQSNPSTDNIPPEGEGVKERRGILGDERGSIPLAPDWMKPDKTAERVREAMRGNKAAAKVQYMHEVTRAELAERKSLKAAMKEFPAWFEREWLDKSGNVKWALRKLGGDIAERARIRFDLIAGASAKAAEYVEKAKDRIYGGLSDKEIETLNDIIESRRTVTIDKYRNAAFDRIMRDFKALEGGEKKRAALERGVSSARNEVKEEAFGAGASKAESLPAGLRANIRAAVDVLARIRAKGLEWEQADDLMTALQSVLEARAMGLSAKAYIAQGKFERTLSAPASRWLERVMGDSADGFRKRLNDSLGGLVVGMNKGVGEASMIDDIRLQKLLERNRPVSHPHGLTGKEHEAWLKALPADVQRKLAPRAEYYFAAMKEQLRDLRNNGLLDEKSYEALLSKGDYSPRWFIDHIDPVRINEIGGQKNSVPDSGIKRLDAGSIAAMEKDSRLLLAEVVERTQNRIMRNEANKQMYTLAKYSPDNGMVRLPPVAKRKLIAGGPQYFPKNPGWTRIDVVIAGKNRQFELPDDLAKQWVTSDPSIAVSLGKWMGRVTGVPILKATATGYNPAFFLTNMRRDIMHAWVASRANWSPAMPVYLAQMSRELAVTARDAFTRKGRYRDYIMQGGGMNFMTRQGMFDPARVFHTGPTSKNWALRGLQKGVAYLGEKSGLGGLRKALHYLGEAMAYVGETSEIWTRLAVRERALREGADPEKATWIARTYLDFAQGGTWAKALDHFIPYFNAGIQGTRGVIDAAKRNPVRVALQMGQIGMVTAGLTWAALAFYKEQYAKIPDDEKRNYDIIMLPFWEKDEHGNRRWLYIRLAHDQTQRLAASIFRNTVAWAMGEKFDIGDVTRSAASLLAFLPDPSATPVLAAMLGHASNYDFWRGKHIWDGPEVNPEAEYTKDTHPAYVWLGKKLHASPERLRYDVGRFIANGNLFADLTGAGTKMMMEGLPEDTQDSIMKEVVNNHLPGLNRIVRFTLPYKPREIERAKQIQLEVNTRKFDQKEAFYEKLRQFDKDGKSEPVMAAVRAAAPEDRKGLALKFHDWQIIGRLEKIEGMTEKRWWVETAHQTPEARAMTYYDKHSHADAEKQREMERIARRYPHFMSKGFMRTLKALERGEKAVAGEED